MVIFGWVVASMGAAGLVGSIVLEIIKKEPIYLLFAKVSMGIMAIGGIALGINALG